MIEIIKRIIKKIKFLKYLKKNEHTLIKSGIGVY